MPLTLACQLLIPYLESNPLALGIDWMDEEGIFVTVYMFDNEEDFKKQWA